MPALTKHPVIHLTTIERLFGSPNVHVKINLPTFGVIIKNAGRKASINPPNIQKSGLYPTSYKIVEDSFAGTI